MIKNMYHMKKTYIPFFLFLLVMVTSSCNDEWKDEQFENFVSFKAPLTGEGVTDIYVRYRGGEKTTFQQPLLVSGSTSNKKDITVGIEVDTDTLDVLNYERFQNRDDFYYRELMSEYFSIPSTVDIKAGQSIALMPIDFTLKDIDMTEKWVLP